MIYALQPIFQAINLEGRSQSVSAGGGVLPSSPSTEISCVGSSETRGMKRGNSGRLVVGAHME